MCVCIYVCVGVYKVVITLCKEKYGGEKKELDKSVILWALQSLNLGAICVS